MSTNRINDNAFTQNILIRIRNHKNKSVPVVVQDNLMEQMNWTIETTKNTYRKIDYRTIEFKFNLPANSEKQIMYQVRYERYTW